MKQKKQSFWTWWKKIFIFICSVIMVLRREYSTPKKEGLKMDERLVKMQVAGIVLNPFTNVFIIVLTSVDTANKLLPIWIGIFEANAIISKIKNITPARPMTHDLIKNIIERANSKVISVIITDLIDNTFYATIELLVNGNIVKVGSRPSDAIALALRMEAPIFATEQVINKVQTIVVAEGGKRKDSVNQWKKWLEQANPEDFGKYKM
jgi:hypothetical protein